MRVVSTIAAALLLSATGSAALAQAPIVQDPAAQSPRPGCEDPGMVGCNPFTLANIDPLQPFGEITVENATNPDALAAWAQSLSDEQLTELDQRCTVIIEAPEFAADPRAFCDMWAIVRAEEMGDPAAAAIENPAAAGPGNVQTPPPGTPAAPTP